MEEVLLMLVGAKIKLYRKQKHLSIEQLAALIGKSKSTVSKYESGKIAIDVLSIYELAKALEIHVSQLLPKINQKATIFNSSVNSLYNSPILYFYYYSGTKKKIIASVIELFPDCETNELKSIAYVNISSYDSYENCEYIYSGNINISERITNFNLTNQSFVAEKFNLTLINPMNANFPTYGMMSAVSVNNLSPISGKIIMSKNILKHSEQLKEDLSINKEDLHRLKTTNLFSIEMAKP